MSQHPESSRCAGGEPVEFHWVGQSAQAGPGDIEVAVELFTELITGPSTRVWDPRHLAITKSEFRSRIKRAESGRLKPLTGVKAIERGRDEFVFEIIYDFSVVDMIDGRRVQSKARVRLYVAEPPDVPGVFIGLHLHEKQVDKSDHARENQLQNLEIDKAIAVYKAGLPNKWGISG